jgi:5-hydroxyisourate hydrolase-like protein (transthyretin family)
MGLIYRKRVKAGKNTTVNLSKSGASVSEHVGPVTVNSRGRVTVRLLPGLTFRLGKRR